MSDKPLPLRALEDEEKELLKAQAQKERAEAGKFRFEAREAKARAVAAEHLSIVTQIESQEVAEKRDEELLKNHRHNVYVFDKSVSDSTVKDAIKEITSWTRAGEDLDIELQINSPGGDIFAGFAFVDFLAEVRRNHNVTTVAYGMAASMGGVLLQAGTKRIMGKNAMLLLHEGSLGAIGDYDSVKDRVKLMELLHDNILRIFASRARPINKKTTERWIKARWSRKDWWLTANDCLELGFCDEVRAAV